MTAWGGERRSGSNQQYFRLWAGLSNLEETGASGLGGGERDGTAAWSELQHVFSFLEARDLLSAAQVNKVRSQVGSPHRSAPPARGRRGISCRDWLGQSGGTALPFPLPS